MPSPLTLPIVAGLSIIGGLGGIWLGHSAVDQVNPFFFSEPEPRFHADQVPYRSPDWAQVRATEEALSAGSEIVSCIGCRNWPQEYRPIRDAAFASFDSAEYEWSPAVSRGAARSSDIAYGPAPEPAPESPATTAEPDAEWRRLQAYSSYPVDARERRSAADELNDEAIAAAEDEAMDAGDDSGTE